MGFLNIYFLCSVFLLFYKVCESCMQTPVADESDLIPIGSPGVSPGTAPPTGPPCDGTFCMCCPTPIVDGQGQCGGDVFFISFGQCGEENIQNLICGNGCSVITRSGAGVDSAPEFDNVNVQCDTTTGKYKSLVDGSEVVTARCVD